MGFCRGFMANASPFLLLLLLLLLSWPLAANAAGALPPCDFPAIYNFGDSNSDTGGISAAFEPIEPPYGERFKKLFGRDSDGRLIVDFIAERLRLPYLSAYLDSIGANYRHGANFATGGSTVRRQNETIYEYGISPFYLGMQITQFDQFKSRSANLYNLVKGTPEADKLPRIEEYSNALYTFDIGQNDLSVGFRKMSVDQIRETIPDIVDQLAAAVEHLYKVHKARAFWIHNTAPFGCLPVNLFYVSNPAPGYLDELGCVKAKNDMSVEFNSKLFERVRQLRKELPEAAITYVDIYAARHTLISNAKKEGFFEPLKPCCGYHVNFTHVWCGKKMKINNTDFYGAVCKNPATSVSWDGVHYSEAANQWVASHTQNGFLTDPPTPITQACHRR